MKLAFIGLGNMGLPMAKNLVNAGYEVYGKNRSKNPEEAFAAAGGKTGLSLKELAQETDVIMTCLPLPKDVEEVLLGQEGVIPHGKKGLIIIDFSTVSPDLNEKVNQAAAARNIEFLDAPVSGGNFGAESGTLSIMVGGKKEVYDKVYSIFDVLGGNIYHTGPVGSGSVVKLINQYMVSVHTQAAGEALVLAEKMGMDKDLLFSILNASYAQSRIFERHYQNFIAKDSFKAGFAIKLLHKDTTLVKKMADTKGVQLPVGEHVTSLLEKAIESGHGDEDMAAMYLYMKEQQ